MPSIDAIVVSLEFRFLVDRALAAQMDGRPDVQDTYSRAAQGLLEATLPEIAKDIAKVASRKGQGDVIAVGMVRYLTPRTAAAVCVVWLLRAARSPAINALKDRFSAEPMFNETLRVLCRQALGPPMATASNAVATFSLGPFTPVETSAPYRS